MDTKRFMGKVAVVTGGAQGIGRAVARRLAREGAKVIVVDRNGEGARRVLVDLETLGSLGTAVAVDLQSEDCGSHIVREAMASQGRIDLAVLCAGITAIVDWTQMTSAEWN